MSFENLGDKVPSRTLKLFKVLSFDLESSLGSTSGFGVCVFAGVLDVLLFGTDGLGLVGSATVTVVPPIHT